MNRTRIRSGVLATLVTVVAAGLSAPPAHAASTGWSYIATAGGTYVTALNSVVTSDLTSQTGISGGPAGKTSTNTIGSADVSGLLHTGAITTSSRSIALTDGVELTSTAKTAGVNLLNGLITADAVETTATTKGAATTSATARTRLVNLKIVGVTLPVEIPENYSVTIPGVATVAINGYVSAEDKGSRATQAWGLGVVLLKSRGDAPAGAQIFVNPIFQLVSPTPPVEGAKIGGAAYGTRIDSSAAGTVSVRSDATALISTPFGSSNGATLRNATAAVNVPGILTTGAVESTTTSTKSGTSDAFVHNTNELARVNVLGGLVTADAIKVSAQGKRVSGTYTGAMAMTLVNLKVAGQTIPLNVAPNTTIDVAGLGKVVVNQQVQQGSLNVIRGVQITLTTAQAGLPVGAVIDIGAAYTAIN